MGKIIKVEGYEAFLEKLDELKETCKPLFLLFSGSKDAQTGKYICLEKRGMMCCAIMF